MDISGGQLVEIVAIGGSVTGGSFALARRLLDYLNDKFQSDEVKRTRRDESNADRCPFGPLNLEAWANLKTQVSETKGMVEEIEGCAWRDRDEVIELKLALLQSAESSKALSGNVEVLTGEMRRLRAALGG